MALGRKQDILELDTAIDDAVLMQELDGQADFSCVEPDACVNIVRIPHTKCPAALL